MSRPRTRETAQEESPRNESKTEIVIVNKEVSQMGDQMNERSSDLGAKFEKLNDYIENLLSLLISGFGDIVKTVHNDQKKFEEKVTKQMDHVHMTFEAYKQEQKKERENYKKEVSKIIEDQLKMAMDRQSADISNQMASLNNENWKNWQEFKRQHDIGTSSKSDLKQLETTVESKIKKVADDVKDLDNRFREKSLEIETEIKNLNSKIEEKATQVANDVNHLKGIWKIFEAKIQAAEEQIELQRTESRDLQQRIEKIKQATKEDQGDIDDLIHDFNVIHKGMSTEKEKTHAELGNVRQNFEEVNKILNNHKKEMQEITDRHTREILSLKILMEENYRQLKQEKAKEPSINNLSDDMIIKVFRAMMDATKEHISTVEKEEFQQMVKETRTEFQQMVEEMAQMTKPNAKEEPLTEKKIRDIVVKAIAEERELADSYERREIECYTQLMKDVKECLPLLILEEDETLAAKCTNTFRVSDTEGMKVRPLGTFATLEQKYTTIVALQDQLKYKCIKFSEWGIFLSMLVGRTISADFDFPSEITTDNWLRMLLKLFEPHDVRQERIDHIYAMLQQRPTKDQDLTAWLNLFITQVQLAGSGNHLIATKQAVRDILEEQNAPFNGRQLSMTANLAEMKLFVKSLNLPNKRPKPKVSKISMAMNGF
ncbi:hypothetical protein B5S30_g3577 [[Candida] boidinii]|nr:hypothetical protein B5S30_g3577 [[Candida] boidinii]